MSSPMGLAIQRNMRRIPEGGHPRPRSALIQPAHGLPEFEASCKQCESVAARKSWEPVERNRLCRIVDIGT